MVLSEKERKLATALLKYVPAADLESLAQTVTKGMLTPCTKEECVKAIVLHSESPLSLLTRKKVTKEILFAYSHDNDIHVEASWEKGSLISSIIQTWKCRASENQPEDPCVQTTDTAYGGLSAQEVGELAQKFSEWFYQLLNKHEQGSECLTTDHFWGDCSIHLRMVSSSNSVDHRVQNDAAGVVQLLSDIKFHHSLYFNPNLSHSGVRGQLDCHGLVAVFVCGTLHQTDKCVGVFEQIFFLARDPFALNNWKIKNTQLRLSNEEVKSEPVLNEVGMTQLLSLPY